MQVQVQEQAQASRGTFVDPIARKMSANPGVQRSNTQYRGAADLTQDQEKATRKTTRTKRVPVEPGINDKLYFKKSIDNLPVSTKEEKKVTINFTDVEKNMVVLQQSGYQSRDSKHAKDHTESPIPPPFGKGPDNPYVVDTESLNTWSRTYKSGDQVISNPKTINGRQQLELMGANLGLSKIKLGRNRGNIPYANANGYNGWMKVAAKMKV